MASQWRPQDQPHAQPTRIPDGARRGGPAAVTAKFRELGDTVTRLDRREPDIGLVLSADLRDTTSPLAMAQLVRRIEPRHEAALAEVGRIAAEWAMGANEAARAAGRRVTAL